MRSLLTQLMSKRIGRMRPCVIKTRVIPILRLCASKNILPLGWAAGQTSTPNKLSESMPINQRISSLKSPEIHPLCVDKPPLTRF